MAKIAILGFGTVGSGVFETLIKNKNIIHKNSNELVEVKSVLDIKKFPGEEVESYITNDFNEILNDSEISIVVETMGGLVPAYSYVIKLLKSGKNVVTSNKELVEKHGDELLKIALENNVSFLFEASVGGGIPLIKTINTSLKCEEISGITAILNGTTNYILTKMDEVKIDYEDVLLEAQKMGYAEKNPEADVEGYDTGRKISILISLIFGKKVDFKDIYIKGIADITQRDFEYAKKYGGTIKLVGSVKVTENGIYSFVSPVIVDRNHPFININDSFNGVLMKGNIIDEVMLYGRGAGKFPTASAVVSDIMDIIKNKENSRILPWSSESENLLNINELELKKLVVISAKDIDYAKKVILNAFGNVDYIWNNYESYLADTYEIAFVTNNEILGTINEKINILNSTENISVLSSQIILSSV